MERGWRAAEEQPVQWGGAPGVVAGLCKRGGLTIISKVFATHAAFFIKDLPEQIPGLWLRVDVIVGALVVLSDVKYLPCK